MKEPTPSKRQILGRYAFDDADGELGAGDYGEVWKAHDVKLDRLVALKFVPESSGQELALRHARALAATGAHSNVVQVYDVHEDVPQPGVDARCGVVVMEHIDGQCLSRVLGGATLELPSALRLCQGILDGLEHLHRAGVAHGDLHDDNILVTEGRPKLIDTAYDALSLTRLTQARRVERDLEAAARLIARLLSLAGQSHVSFLEACPERSIDAQRAALGKLVTHSSPEQLSLAAREVRLEIKYALVSAERDESGYCYCHAYVLIARIRNEGEKVVRTWHIDVEIPNDVRPPQTSYSHEVVERRASATFLVRKSDVSEGGEQIYPGDTIELTVPYMVDHALYYRGDDWESQAFVVRAFVDGVALESVRRTIGEMNNF